MGVAKKIAAPSSSLSSLSIASVEIEYGWVEKNATEGVSAMVEDEERRRRRRSRRRVRQHDMDGSNGVRDRGNTSFPELYEG